MKPMLAAVASLKNIEYPVFVSPKLDGIRCLIIDGVARGRSLKPLPNKHVQALFGTELLNGLDGELIVGGATSPDVFQKTMSGVMSVDGEPDVTFQVFDKYAPNSPFSRRIHYAALTACHVNCVHLVPQTLVRNGDELSTLEERYVSQGYEGVMLRDINGLYKHGRSTVKEGGLLKVKRFVDAEAVIIGCTELMHNSNAAQVNLLGQSERSSHKAGKVGTQTLGALIVRDIKTGVEFEIGTGFNAAQRRYLWRIRHALPLGKIVKYKYQPTGVKDKPRFPVFLGFRDAIDMDV